MAIYQQHFADRQMVLTGNGSMFKSKKLALMTSVIDRVPISASNKPVNRLDSHALSLPRQYTDLANCFSLAFFRNQRGRTFKVL
jgi:hypothetical protein